MESEEIDIDVDAVDSADETALTKSAISRNSIACNDVSSKVFLQAVSNVRYFTRVTNFLNSSRYEYSGHTEPFCVQPITKRFSLNIVAFDSERPRGSCITFSDWLRALHIVDSSMYTGLLDLLFRFEMSVWGVDKEGWTTLHRALFLYQHQPVDDHFDGIETLLDTGKFDANAITGDQETALHFACRAPQSGEIVLELLKSGVNVNKVNVSGQTALMIACQYECTDGIRELLNWNKVYDNLDLDVNDNDGRTTLFYARQSKNLKVVAMIEQALFLSAVKNGDAETTKIYLSTPTKEILYRRPGIDGHITSRNNFITQSVWLEAVWLAKSNSFGDILTMLLEDDRFIRGVSDDGETVLHLAVKEYLNISNASYDSQNFEKIKILLESGRCDVNALNSKKETALHLICSMWTYHELPEVEEFLKLLIEHKIDLNCVNLSGRTPLMLACENEYRVIVQTLLNLRSKSGILLDVNVVDNSGKTALMIASEKGNSKIAALLRREIFLTAIENKNNEPVIALLDGAKTNDDKPFKSWSKYLDKKRTSNSEMSFDFSSWEEAMHVAIETASDDIIRLLLDYDPVVESQFRGNSVIQWLLREKSDFSVKELRLTEILLESGRINVNAINFEANTALHLLLKRWGGRERENTCSLKEIDVTTELFLRHGANFNQKNKFGETPLAIASEIGCVSFLRTILNWANAVGTRLDLDATDIYGQTALAKAAIWKHPEVVELLLTAGASVNLSDYCGLAALHHALSETLINELWIDFGDFPQNCIELNNRRKINLTIFDIEEEYPKVYKRSVSQLNEDRKRTVNLLLGRSGIDVNKLGGVVYSPLDIAEAFILEDPSPVKELLRSKGAILNAFSENRQPSSNVTYNKYENHLHRLAVDNTMDGDSAKENLLKLSPAILKQLAVSKDQKGRTPLHCSVMPIFESNDIEITDLLISIGSDVNETDIYGRTPLHYADNEIMMSQLLSYGADENVQDKDGISASYMMNIVHERISSKTVKLVNDITNSLPYGVEDLIKDQRSSDGNIYFSERSSQKRISEKLLKFGEFAIRHPSASQVANEVTEFIEDLAFEIKRRDPRFEAKFQLVGSSYEGTRVNRPDEFDFNLVLTRLSPLCEVCHSPELPTGFVHLKRKHTTNNISQKSNIDSFFDEDGFLAAQRVRTLFKITLADVLKDTEFINRHLNFDWNYHSKFEWLTSTDLETELAATLKMKQTKLDLNSKRGFMQISIDIVICIHIDGWWPDEAIRHVDDDIKIKGCNLVFDNPQRLYPWVPYSESCARISFSSPESEMIKRAPGAAKQAYMMGKHLITRAFYTYSYSRTSYPLKNCLLYCIEALSASELGSNPDALENVGANIWLESLMKCHLDCVLQDFCPSYFMPAVSLPTVERYLKSNHMSCWTDECSAFLEYCLDAYKLHRDTSLSNRDVCLKLPSPNPIFDRFDRTAMITDLSKFMSRSLDSGSDGNDVNLSESDDSQSSSCDSDDDSDSCTDSNVSDSEYSSN